MERVKLIKAFAGDRYLGEEFEKLIKKFKIKNIIETGTSKGDSTKEFSKMIENVYTIESVKKTYLFSKEILKDFRYFCSKINFGDSFLDAKAVTIMNEIGGKIEKLESQGGKNEKICN